MSQGRAHSGAGLDSSSDSFPKTMEFFFPSLFREQLSLGQTVALCLECFGIAGWCTQLPEFSSFLLISEPGKANKMKGLSLQKGGMNL